MVTYDNTVTPLAPSDNSHTSRAHCNCIFWVILARQRFRQGSVRAADVGDARPGAQPHAGAQGQQEPRAARADARRHRREVSRLHHCSTAPLHHCTTAHTLLRALVYV